MEPRRYMRPRRYVSRTTLVMAWPFFCYSHVRDAYVLRVAGDRFGPVLRPERRLRHRERYTGVERRGAREMVGV